MIFVGITSLILPVSSVLWLQCLLTSKVLGMITKWRYGEQRHLVGLVGKLHCTHGKLPEDVYMFIIIELIVHNIFTGVSLM